MSWKLPGVRDLVALDEIGERARLCLVLENADPNIARIEIEDRCELAWFARHGIEAPDER